MKNLPPLTSSSLLRANSWALVLLQIGLLLLPSFAQANPLAPNVVAGSATINQAGSTTTIHQATNRAIINWQSFSISPGEVTQFIQPGSSAAILNRVTGGDPSAILGSLQSNGRVFLINPNGIVFGQGAQINVGGLVASTLDINNAEFMRGGDLNFQGNSTASVINRGEIRALEGDIFLIGARVENHGLLQASHGTVGLAAGQDVRLVDSGHKHLVVRPNANSLGGTGILNTGTINAVQAELAANGGNVYALAINNKGTVRANGSVVKNGRVLLTADGGKVENSGDLIAKNADDTGGTVHVLGDEVRLAGGTIDVSGANGGGVALVGGDYQGSNPDISNAQTVYVDGATINANATVNGNGGRVIVWSDDRTDFAGTITARGGANGGDGGFVEISGKQTLTIADGSIVDTRAPNGQTGMLLLDPGRINIGVPTLAGFGVQTFSAAFFNTLWDMTNINASTAVFGSGVGPDDINIWEPLFPGNAMMATGNSVTLVAGRDINMFANMTNKGNGAFNFIAGRDVNFMAKLQSGAIATVSGGGSINITAGENVNLTSQPGDIRAAFGPLAKRNVRVETFSGNITIITGNDPSPMVGGNLNIFSAVNRLAMVGSRFGDVDITTNSRADGTAGRVDLQSRGGRVQIGFDRHNSTMGADITIAADNRIDITANQSGDLAKIGHGQAGQNLRFNGDINITQGTRVRVQALGEDSTVQVGHGGPGTNIRPGLMGTPTGNITINVDRAQVFANGQGSTAQIGHGGRDGSGTVIGNISLTVADDLRLATFDPSQAVPALMDQRDATAQIGHGGRDFNESAMMPGTLSGSIDVVVTATDLTMTARGEEDMVQIGHGGYGAIGSIGAINVTATKIDLLASGVGSTDQIGHGGAFSTGDHEGDITVNATGTTMGSGFVRLTAEGDGSTTQIGHGGREASGSADGKIEITADGFAASSFAVELRSTVEGNFAHIGHGGADFNEGGMPGNLLGAIEIAAPRGGIRARAGGESSPVQIGHGGDYSRSDVTNGTIMIDAMGDLIFTAGTGEDAYAQLGHGGNHAEGEMMGNIRVTANNIAFTGGEGENSYAQLGHGGNESEGEFSGEIRVRGADITFTGGNENDTYAQLGHGGDAFEGILGGRIRVNSTGNIEFTAGSGSDAYAQLGHGGAGAEIYDELRGRIRVTATGDIIFTAGSDDETYAQIGHGGADTYLDGNIRGRINVTAGNDVILQGGEGYVSYAQIGHGGTIEDSTYGNIRGRITVNASRDIILNGGTGAMSYAQIGHGGSSYEGEFGRIRGDIYVEAGNDIKLIGGNGYIANAQIGHGGMVADGSYQRIRGDIEVNAGRDLLLTGGYGPMNYAQIGHGGSVYEGEYGKIFGDISATAGRDIVLSGAGMFGYMSYAQIGHGGTLDDYSYGKILGDIYVAADRDVLLTGGSGFANYAQIGHGGSVGYGEYDEIDGNITVLAGRDIKLTGGMLSYLAQVECEGECEGGVNYAQIGHGGYLYRGENDDLIGNILTVAGRDIMITGGNSFASYAQIGHGGLNELGDQKDFYGDIYVIAGHDLMMTAPNDSSQARIGHGGITINSSQGYSFGDVTIAWDQVNPWADNGGRFFMNHHSEITAQTHYGHFPTVNTIRLFGTRRLGNVIEDGALIGGIPFGSGLSTPHYDETMGVNFGWNVNTEFQSWDHEQWGLFTLLTPGPYTGRFTFYYLDFSEVQCPTYDCFERYELYANTFMAMFGQGPYSMLYGPEGDRPMGEMDGNNSSGTFEN